MSPRCPASLLASAAAFATILAFAAGLAATPARAQTRPAPAPAAAPPRPAPSAEPQQTAATFGDWVVRCTRTDGARRVCEAAQQMTIKGQSAPIAQVAFALGEGEGVALTALLPLSLSFSKPPTFGLEGEDPRPMTVRRCVPAGCFADARIDAATLKQFREATKQGRLSFPDAADRPAALPVSFYGLAQALDDLAKEAKR